MASGKIDRIRRLFSAGRWSISFHVQAYIEQGEFDEDDIEACVSGGVITKSVKDESGAAIDGKKHTITGPDTYGLGFCVVGKLIEDFDGQTVFVITAYKEQ